MSKSLLNLPIFELNDQSLIELDSIYTKYDDFEPTLSSEHLSLESLSKDALNFRQNYLEQNKIIHVDSLKILKTSSLDNNENIESYYSEDLHNSKKGFEYILNEFISVYNAI